MKIQKSRVKQIVKEALSSDIEYKDFFKLSVYVLNENRDIKYKQLLIELRNVCKKFQFHLDPSDIKDALVNVSDIYTDD